MWHWAPPSALLLSRGWSLKRSQQIHRLMYLSQMEEFLSWQSLIKTCHLRFCSLRESLWAETVKFLLSLPHRGGGDCSSATETKESEFHYSKSPGDWMSSEALKKRKRKLNVKRSPCWLKSEIRNKAGVFLHLSHILIVLLSALCRIGCYRECSDHFRLLKMLVINMD